MLPSFVLFIVQFFLFIETTVSTANSLKSIVIQVKGECETIGDKIAQEHGYHYVRQVRFHLAFNLRKN